MSESRHKNQVYIMYLGTLLSFFFSISFTFLNTKYLTVDDFGIFKLYQNAGYLLYVVLNFGIFYSSSYLVAKSDDLTEQAELTNASLHLFFVVSVIFVFIISAIDFSLNGLISSYFSDGVMLLLLSFFSVSMINGVQSIYQGMNKIEVMSFIKFIPYLLCSIFFVLLSVRSSEISILLFCVVNIIVVLFYVVGSDFFKVNLRGIRCILQSVRNYGLNVYMGAFLGVGCIYFINMILPMYLDVKNLALVGVALTLSSPLQLIPSIIGVVLFRKFAKGNNCFERGVILSLIFVSLMSVLFFNLVIASVVSILFSDSYSGVVEISRIIGLGYILYGIGDFFNKFVASRGDGVLLRNTSMIVGLSVLAMFFLTIKSHGVYSICYAILSGGFVFSLLSMHNCYRIVKKQNDIK